MTTPHLTAVRLGGRPDQPLLVLGPALGTSARALWGAAAQPLAADFQVVAWDLPGHGTNPWVPEPATDPVAEPLGVADLARGVLAIVDELAGGDGSAFHYAGDSVGGAVGLQLLLDAPQRVRSATLLATGARLGEPAAWQERAATVVASGTSALTSASAERWFAPGFTEREPAAAAALLRALTDTDDTAYAAVCGALATFDVRDRLAEVTVPVLAVAGARDGATPPALLAEVAEGVREGRLAVLEDVAHLPPVEAPVQVARLVRGHALGEAPEQEPPDDGAGAAEPAERSSMTVAEVREAGTAVRKELLGGAYVARATRQATVLTRDFEDLLAEQVWGGVWSRPGLDRRTRAAVTLAVLVAAGHQEAVALHVRAARASGLSVEEIREVLLQTAAYCGVAAADAAFRTAQQVLADGGEL